MSAFERELLERTCARLWQPLERVLRNYRRWFPSSAVHALGEVIALAGQVHSLRVRLGVANEGDADNFLDVALGHIAVGTDHAYAEKKAALVAAAAKAAAEAAAARPKSIARIRHRSISAGSTGSGRGPSSASRTPPTTS